MANTSLGIETLSRSVQMGNMDTFMGNNVASDLRVSKEMQAQGMETSTQAGGGSFGDMLRNAVDRVNVDQHEANKAINELVAGRSKNIHETMLAIERADSSLKMMVQVRNKVLDAYKEIMRMQV